MLGHGQEGPGYNAGKGDVDDCPKHDLYEQGLVLPREVRVQERETSINEELHVEIVDKKQ